MLNAISFFHFLLSAIRPASTKLLCVSSFVKLHLDSHGFKNKLLMFLPCIKVSLPCMDLSSIQIHLPLNYFLLLISCLFFDIWMSHLIPVIPRFLICLLCVIINTYASSCSGKHNKKSSFHIMKIHSNYKNLSY